MIAALVFWGSLFGPNREHEATALDNQPQVTLELSSEEIESISKTKDLDELFEVAEKVIKKRIEEKADRKAGSEPEQAASKTRN